ncbi:hypothetical protein LTR96_000296 [Exophiala xenobiotica]|nr:hypothetical protein LTR96_000296 [Exophiala xenobiotica]KAK5373674.1 hypothetical protein LTS13_005873 [Exophiala xenobiotica]KAK5402354.1 hypothetical protein LTR79_001082 [Exophiala xenobiotica]KAK5419225.1 hypothetical protein LTR90_004288 [Exophiala xenobiotica]KAK5488161.1 hypothetical protein LTR83_007797 [Exophiala xenobiotica]
MGQCTSEKLENTNAETNMIAPYQPVNQTAHVSDTNGAVATSEPSDDARTVTTAKVSDKTGKKVTNQLTDPENPLVEGSIAVSVDSHSTIPGCFVNILVHIHFPFVPTDAHSKAQVARLQKVKGMAIEMMKQDDTIRADIDLLEKLLSSRVAEQSEVTRILGKGDGSVPILYEASIRVPYTASRQVFMGAPDYARPWPNALKADRDLAVIEGHANTVEQVKYIGTILSINKVRDPLKKWQRGGPKRMVFTKKFLEWFFLSFPNSPYTIKKFKSGFKFGRHTFERSALLTTMAAIHDMEWQSNGMRASDKESLDMKIMPIAGAKGGKLYGLALRHEDDDYSLSDGMHFKIFFKRDKATEERAGKKAEWYFRGWHGRDCHLNSPQCRFFVADITILGHHGDHDGIKPSLKRVAAFANRPTPHDEPSLLRFLYQLPYMMQFSPGRADIEAKLRTAIKSEQLEFKANGKTRKARRTDAEFEEAVFAHSKTGETTKVDEEAKKASKLSEKVDEDEDAA